MEGLSFGEKNKNWWKIADTNFNLLLVIVAFLGISIPLAKIFNFLAWSALYLVQWKYFIIVSLLYLLWSAIDNITIFSKVSLFSWIWIRFFKTIGISLSPLNDISVSWITLLMKSGDWPSAATEANFNFSCVLLYSFWKWYFSPHLGMPLSFFWFEI